MCVPRIKIVNVSSNIADMYNLRVAAYEVEFDRETIRNVSLILLVILQE